MLAHICLILLHPPRGPKPPHGLLLGRLPLDQRGALLHDDLFREPGQPSHVDQERHRGAGHPDIICHAGPHATQPPP